MSFFQLSLGVALDLKRVVSFAPSYGDLFCVHGVVQYCQEYLTTSPG